MVVKGLEVSVVIGATLVVGLSVLTWFVKKRIDRKKLRLVGRISHLVIYPVKSCRGIEVDSAECTQLGLVKDLAKDRTFVICTEDGEVLTARNRPTQVLITPSFHGDAFLRLEAPQMEPIDVRAVTYVPGQDNRPIRKCTVSGGTIEGRDCGDEVGRWIDRYFHGDSSRPKFRLLQFDEIGSESRHVTLYKAKAKAAGLTLDARGEWDAFAVPYADLAPYLLLSEASIADLNARLNNPVKYGNFRPNVVVRECGPYAEDQWDQISIGSQATFTNFLPCDRCTYPNIDTETGERSTNMEPLKTLKTYRQSTNKILKKLFKDKPMMGVNLGLQTPGMVRIGDPVYATLK